MSTQQYAMVRGSAIRVTELGACGSLQDGPIRYGVSKCVTRVSIKEVLDGGGNEVVRNDEDDPALHFVTDPELLGYIADIEFIKVDPGILSLVAGVDPVHDWGSDTDIIGFDTKMRVKTVAFGLEVWSRIAGQVCISGEVGFGEGPFGETPFGEGGTAPGRRYGYSLFPYLKGGYISGYEFNNGTVTFTVTGAQTRAGAKWASGPYVLVEGENTRLPKPVSGNTAWRNFIYPGTPPEPTEGIVEFNDAIDGGNATFTSSDTLDGEFVITSADTVEGGAAA